jgi:phage terminase small subunit
VAGVLSPRHGIVGASKALGLTEMQAHFVRHFCSGRAKAESARLAGYEGDHDVVSTTLFRNPVILTAIRVEVSRFLSTAAPGAARVLDKLAHDEAVPPAVRRNCARDLIGLAGWVPPKAEGAESAIEKPLTERTTAELHDLVAKLEGELAGRATPVNAQNAQDDEAKPLDWLD